MSIMMINMRFKGVFGLFSGKISLAWVWAISPFRSVFGRIPASGGVI